jgi:hypothetical protein
LRLVFPAPNCGGFAKVESVVAGFQRGFRFLSLLMLTLGLPLALLLWHAARALRVPQGAGWEMVQCQA